MCEATKTPLSRAACVIVPGTLAVEHTAFVRDKTRADQAAVDKVREDPETGN